MAKITPVDKTTREKVSVKTKTSINKTLMGYNWWEGKSQRERNEQLLATVGFLREQQSYRQRQASIHARMYGNLPLAGWAGTNLTKFNTNNSLPLDRPTMNVIQSCVDTLVSRISQSKPKPLFLTDNGDYKQRKLAKQMNAFIAGEFYQTKIYEKGRMALRDASVLGPGLLKVIETEDKRVGVERVLGTDILVDQNDGFYGTPRCLYQLKLVDRSVLRSMLPKERSTIEQAEQAFPDNSGDSTKTTSDQIMLVEAWRLPSKKDADDGRHIIACTSGSILDEEYDKPYFPFTMLPYSPRLVGYWPQGLAEQLMGTQIEINKILVTISQSISLVGVPRVFVEDGSKVVKAHLNNQVGAIVTYRGTKPSYEVAPCVPQELYAQLQRLVEYAYQQSGVSALAATSQKPQGLNSGEAIRSYDDLQSDRFAVLNQRYNDMYVDLAYKMIDMAKDIAERDGKYQTIYPNKDGTREICLPEIDLIRDSFIIQCFDTSSLPKEPTGRLAKIVEMMQAGLISPSEGRRLLDYPDLEQVDKLENAAEERILKMLDDIVEDGKYTPPDPYTDITLAEKLVAQYYNLYTAAKLTEARAEMLRNWQAQVQVLKQAMMAPVAPVQAPQAVPEAPPTSNLLPNIPNQ